MNRLWRIPYVVVLTLGCGLLIILSVNLFDLQRETEIFTTAATQNAVTNTAIVAQVLEREVKQQAWAQVQMQLRRLNGQPIRTYYQIIAGDGRILGDSRRIEPTGRLDLPFATQVLAGATIVQVAPDEPHLIQVAIPLSDQSGQPAALLLNVTDWSAQLTAMQSQARAATMLVVLIAIALTLLILAFLWYFVGFPLERLRRLAEAVTNGAGEARTPPFPMVELQQVGRALNQMLDRNAAQQAELTRINRSLQTTNRALQTQTETVQTINQIGRLLSAETDQQKLAQAVIAATTELTGAEVGAFFYDEISATGESGHFYAVAGMPTPTPTAFMSSNTALLAHTFQGQGVVRLDDVRLDPRYGQQEPHDGLPPGHVPVVSYLAAPIVSRFGQTMGGLFFGHTQAGIFTERAEQLVVGLVAQIAVGMDNARLFAAAQREISERKAAETRLSASLTEKEVLLKEIHHRVKNNLQIISSLLTLQSRQVTEQPVMEIFRESQNRIRSMAIIHEKLYQAPDLTQIDFAEYIHSLVGYLFRSYGVNTDVIRLQVNVPDLTLRLDTAIPCGLIINELVSNALKYAFAPNQPGTIAIALACRPDQQLCLTVSDNGRGLPPAIDFRCSDSFGLQLVSLLTEQLDGVIDLERNGGATFTVTFYEQPR